MATTGDVISCPSCGAPVPMDPGIVVYRCGFCHHEVRVPEGHAAGTRPLQFRRHDAEAWTSHPPAVRTSSSAGCLAGIIVAVVAIVVAVILSASSRSSSMPHQTRRHY